MEKIKKYKIWYKIFLILGLLGILNIATTSIIKQNYNLDMGGVSFCVMYAFAYLFGSSIGAFVGVYGNGLLSFAILWLVLAYFMKQKTNATENPTEENLSYLKRAKIITLSVGGIILVLIIYTLYLVNSR